MTRNEFFALLILNGINEKQVAVSFEPNLKDGHCIRKNRTGWEVFVKERGKEYNSIGFPSESDALQYLYNELLSIYGK